MKDYFKYNRMTDAEIVDQIKSLVVAPGSWTRNDRDDMLLEVAERITNLSAFAFPKGA